MLNQKTRMMRSFNQTETKQADTNMKPSLIVQQQRQIQMGISSANPNLTTKHGGPETINQQSSSSMKAANELSGIIQYQQQQQSSNQNQMMFDQNGLVLPKRVLPSNPAGLVNQPIIRDLNRELKFNQIRGKNVLDQKSELKRAMKKLEENKRRKEADQERLNRRSSLELRLEERAERLAKDTRLRNELDNNNNTSETTATCNSEQIGIMPINR